MNKRIDGALNFLVRRILDWLLFPYMRQPGVSMRQELDQRKDRLSALWNEREEYVRSLEDAVSDLGDYAFDLSPSSRMDSTRLAQRIAVNKWRELHAEIRERRGGKDE